MYDKSTHLADGEVHPILFTTVVESTTKPHGVCAPPFVRATARVSKIRYTADKSARPGINGVAAER